MTSFRTIAGRLLGRGGRKPHKTRAGQIAMTLARHGVTLVLDVGANTGQTGLELRGAGYMGRIVSFEPVAASRAELAKVLDERWEMAPPMALGERRGEATVKVSEATDMSSIRAAAPALLEALPRTRVLREETVPLERLDAVFDRFARPDDVVFLKIDTQGFEREVLEGARGVMDRIAGLQMEMSLLPLYEGERLLIDHLIALRELGFEPWLLLPVTFSRRLARQLQVDGVFFRR